MEQKRGRGKKSIELRYYEVPEHEVALVLEGEEWVRTYGEETEDLHFHNLMEIGVCRWGEGEMIFDDKSIHYGPGAVSVIPANCLHTTVSREQSLNEWAYFFVDLQSLLESAYPNDAIFVESVMRRLDNHSVFYPNAAADTLHFASMIELAMNEYKPDHIDRDYHNGIVQGLLVSLLLLAARKADEDAEPLPPRVPGLRQIMPAMEYINRNYMNPVTIAELAAACSLSEAQLRRKFQEYLRMSPLDQLTLVRIRNGCRLMNTTSESMLEIALHVGYQSVSSFERNFQKLLGMSPCQYKKLQKDYKSRLLRFKVTAKKGWVSRDDD